MTAFPDTAPAATSYGIAGKLRGGARMAIILAWIFVNMPLQVFFRAFNLPARFTFPHWFHGTVTRGLLNMQIEVRGTPSTARPTLFLSNHLSYVDIPVISAVVATSFVSRADVAGWPLLGLLAKLQDTVFVERRARAKTGEQNLALKKFLQDGHNLVLFAEGTSTDGSAVLPFKSSLLQGVLEAGDISIQPLSLACVNDDGSQHLYPWYGDMNFPDHVWPFLQAPRFKLCLTFHPPVVARQFADRKALADQAYQAVISAPCGVKP
ncbi:MAG TPA: lysophospholipid acyltransferase family protein [Alphaproteobacteria bacterium]|nr:lysophospholipid acyltransferase family protein [Alphaproteobacteria bacterium]